MPCKTIDWKSCVNTAFLIQVQISFVPRADIRMKHSKPFLRFIFTSINKIAIKRIFFGKKKKQTFISKEDILKLAWSTVDKTWSWKPDLQLSLFFKSARCKIFGLVYFTNRQEYGWSLRNAGTKRLKYCPKNLFKMTVLRVKGSKLYWKSLEAAEVSNKHELREWWE